MEYKKRIGILGSTGSIGRQTLEVVEKISDKIEVTALAAGNNVELLKAQIRKFHPKVVSVKNEFSVKELRAEFKDLEITCSTEGMERICSDKELCDLVVVAVSGRVGLKPTFTALRNRIAVALANKETLVMGGDFVMNEVKKSRANLIPIDSEHCAIHQCIKERKDVKKLIITASGGPFLRKSMLEMRNATIEQTLKHPRWDMGRKITVDSATLMNKGLEVIEAHHLFDMNYDDIEVVVHPQSVVHSAVEYVDGSVVAQLGVPSMHIPIQYAIMYPERVEGIKSGSFSFVKTQRLDFEEPDLKKFRLLDLAYEAGRVGNSAPICLNAVNEEAVMAFLDGKIKLNRIVELVEDFISKHTVIEPSNIDDVLAIDEEIRTKARACLI